MWNKLTEEQLISIIEVLSLSSSFFVYNMGSTLPKDERPADFLTREEPLTDEDEEKEIALMVYTGNNYGDSLFCKACDILEVAYEIEASVDSYMEHCTNAVPKHMQRYIDEDLLRDDLSEEHSADTIFNGLLDTIEVNDTEYYIYND